MRAAKELRASRALADVLAGTLAVGNYLNYGSRLGACRGEAGPAGATGPSGPGPGAPPPPPLPHPLPPAPPWPGERVARTSRHGAWLGRRWG